MEGKRERENQVHQMCEGMLPTHRSQPAQKMEVLIEIV